MTDPRSHHLTSAADTCYVLSFAVIMLNTSLHNPNVRDKPGLERFVAMNRGINEGGDLPEELLRVRPPLPLPHPLSPLPLPATDPPLVVSLCPSRPPGLPLSHGTVIMPPCPSLFLFLRLPLSLSLSSFSLWPSDFQGLIPSYSPPTRLFLSLRT